MNEAIHCLKCKKKYYDHDIRICPNPHWEDVQEEHKFEVTNEPTVNIGMAQVTPNHPHRLQFYRDNKEVGYLDLDKKMDFQGDATESAKIFFRLVKQMWDQQLQTK